MIKQTKYEVQLEKAKKAAKDMEDLGQDNSEILASIPELEEKVKAYREMAQNDLPEGLYKVRESYQLQHPE
jgi:hypothetical protein